jgi:hypothetical protein
MGIGFVFVFGFVDDVGEVDVADVVVVVVLYGEIGQHSSIGELVVLEEELSAVVGIVNEVASPFLSPSLGLETHRERTC